MGGKSEYAREGIGWVGGVALDGISRVSLPFAASSLPPPLAASTPPPPLAASTIPPSFAACLPYESAARSSQSCFKNAVNIFNNTAAHAAPWRLGAPGTPAAPQRHPAGEASAGVALRAAAAASVTDAGGGLGGHGMRAPAPSIDEGPARPPARLVRVDPRAAVCCCCCRRRRRRRSAGRR